MTLTRPTPTVPLNRLDELFLALDDGEEPWNVHFEVRAAGRLDAERLRDAIREAALRHPLARARLADWRYWDRSYGWEIADTLVDVPLEVVTCDDEPAVSAAREELLSHSPSLDAAPPFTMLLARGPGADTLVLNLHHAAGDGIGAARLMRSILREYAGVEDPTPPVDLLAARDVNALAGARTIADRMTRGRALAEHAVAQQWSRAARVAVDGGDARAGYGVELLPLSREETAAVIARRTDATTVNDVLLAALAVAVRRWNADHGKVPRRVTMSMPVNLRPPEWRLELLGNVASYVTVSGTLAAEDLPGALEFVGRQTRAIKRDGLAGVVVDLLSGYSRLTIAAKRRLPDMLALTGPVAIDTSSLSNLGSLPSLGDDVDAVWFSPPGRMPLGAALGAVTHRDRLHLALRYRHAQFDPAAAHAFAGLYRDVLLG
jgi:NRPS condensation-like uncharacterized protein